MSLLSRPKIKLANISVLKLNNIQPLFHGQLPLSRGLSREMSQFKQVTRNLWQIRRLPEGFLSAVFDLNKIVWEIIAYNFQSLQAQNN